MESLKQWAFCRILENSVSLLSETLLPSSLFTVPSPTLGVIILNIFFLLIWYAFKKQLIVFLCISLITKWGWIFSHVLCLLHFLFCESNLCGSCIFSFSFPLKTPSCGAEEREHAGRARSNDSRAVNQFYWPNVADVQSSTCQDPSYLLETSGLCIQCFKLNSSSCLLWYWAYSSEQSRWKSFKN